MIRFDHVDISYGQAVMVPGLSLDIKEGEFFTLLGPSGCGKSTILRCLAGFVPVAKGHILVDGTDISRLDAERRGVGIVFQNYALFPHLSVTENVAFGLRAAGRPNTEIASAVASILERVGIAEHAQKRPAELSGGQQQRVAIARSLILNPKILLMDEPLSNLDVKMRINMRNEIKRLQQQFGFTTLYVTHDQEEALSLSDRIAVLNRGRVEQVGTPETIYLAPKTEFVCQFIGEANQLTPAMQALSGVPVSEDACFVRPEHLQWAADTRAGSHYMAITVDDRTFLGASIRYRLTAADGHIDMVCASSDRSVPVGTAAIVQFTRAAVLRPGIQS